MSHRVVSVIVRMALAVGALLSAGPARADEQILTRDAEPGFQRLVELVGAGLGHGVTLERLTIEPHRALVRVTTPDGPLTMTLDPPEDDGTPFAVTFAPSPTPQLEAAFLSSLHDAFPTPPWVTLIPDSTLSQVSATTAVPIWWFLALAGALVLLVPLVVRFGLRSLPVTDSIALAGLFATAFALRWWLPEHTLIHENHHAFGHHPSGPLYAAVFPDGSPSAHLVLTWLFHRVCPWRLESVFLYNALSSSVAVAGLYALARVLFRSRLAAWTSSVLLAGLPLAVALAPTEEFLVGASGLVLLGLPLLWLGVHRDHVPSAVCGVLCICLGAGAREITLPLSLCIPLVVIAASGEGRRPRWVMIAIALLVPLAALLPAAVSVVARTWIGMEEGAPAYLSLDWPFGGNWVGWRQPYVPRLLAVVGLGCYGALTLDALWTRRWRPAAVAVGCFLGAQLLSSLVSGGYHTSALRHQYLAVCLLPLPIGWGLAALVEAARRPALYRAAFAIAPVAAALMLGLFWRGVRLDLPQVREYRLFHEHVPGLDPRGQALLIDNPMRLPTLESWLAGVQPGWQFTSDPTDRTRTTYAFLDRTCFAAQYVDERGILRELELVETPYGRMTPACHGILQSRAWQEVATLEVPNKTDHDGPSIDLSSADPHTRLAILASKE